MPRTWMWLRYTTMRFRVPESFDRAMNDICDVEFDRQVQVGKNGLAVRQVI